MTGDTRAELEARLKALCQDGAFHEATRLVIEGYGPEVLGWLSSLVPNEETAEDIFQRFCLALWQGLSGFRWESRLRTWAYRVAWRELVSFREGERRRQECHLPSSQLSQMARQVTTIHSLIRRDQEKSRLVELRQQLPEDLQTLLILRIDREMSFVELAEVLGLTEETARKRFQRAKNQLKEMARREGLLPGREK